MESYIEPTILGTINILPTEYNHIHVSGNITIRNKEAKISAHYYRWSNDEFNLGLESRSLYERNREFYCGYDSTEAFNRKARETISPIIKKWAKDHVTEINLAEQEHLQEAIKKRQVDIDSYKERIKILEEEIAKANRGEHISLYPPSL